MQVIQKTNVIYKVKSGDTISNICAVNKVSQEEFKELNNVDEIFENDVVLLPEKFSKIYVVKPLDTVEKIAKNMNVSVEMVKKKIKDKKIFIGQKIIF